MTRPALATGAAAASQPSPKTGRRRQGADEQSPHATSDQQQLAGIRLQHSMSEQAADTARCAKAGCVPALSTMPSPQSGDDQPASPALHQNSNTADDQLVITAVAHGLTAARLLESCGSDGSSILSSATNQATQAIMPLHQPIDLPTPRPSTGTATTPTSSGSVMLVPRATAIRNNPRQLHAGLLIALAPAVRAVSATSCHDGEQRLSEPTDAANQHQLISKAAAPVAKSRPAPVAGGSIRQDTPNVPLSKSKASGPGTGVAVRSGQVPLQHLGQRQQQKARGLQPQAVTVDPLLVSLRNWRQARARQASKQPSSLLPDQVLQLVAQRRPLTFRELQQVPGLSVVRAQQLGQELLDLVRAELHRAAATASPAPAAAPGTGSSSVSPAASLVGSGFVAGGGSAQLQLRCEGPLPLEAAAGSCDTELSSRSSYSHAADAKAPHAHLLTTGKQGSGGGASPLHQGQVTEQAADGERLAAGRASRAASPDCGFDADAFFAAAAPCAGGASLPRTKMAATGPAQAPEAPSAAAAAAGTVDAAATTAADLGIGSAAVDTAIGTDKLDIKRGDGHHDSDALQQPEAVNDKQLAKGSSAHAAEQPDGAQGRPAQLCPGQTARKARGLPAKPARSAATAEGCGAAAIPIPNRKRPRPVDQTVVSLDTGDTSCTEQPSDEAPPHLKAPTGPVPPAPPAGKATGNNCAATPDAAQEGDTQPVAKAPDSPQLPAFDADVFFAKAPPEPCASPPVARGAGGKAAARPRLQGLPTLSPAAGQLARGRLPSRTVQVPLLPLPSMPTGLARKRKASPGAATLRPPRRTRPASLSSGSPEQAPKRLTAYAHMTSLQCKPTAAMGTTAEMVAEPEVGCTAHMPEAAAPPALAVIGISAPCHEGSTLQPAPDAEPATELVDKATQGDGVVIAVTQAAAQVTSTETQVSDSAGAAAQYEPVLKEEQVLGDAPGLVMPAAACHGTAAGRSLAGMHQRLEVEEKVPISMTIAVGGRAGPKRSRRRRNPAPGKGDGEQGAKERAGPQGFLHRTGDASLKQYSREEDRWILQRVAAGMTEAQVAAIVRRSHNAIVRRVRLLIARASHQSQTSATGPGKVPGQPPAAATAELLPPASASASTSILMSAARAATVEKPAAEVQMEACLSSVSEKGQGLSPGAAASAVPSVAAVDVKLENGGPEAPAGALDEEAVAAVQSILRARAAAARARNAIALPPHLLNPLIKCLQLGPSSSSGSTEVANAVDIMSD